MRKDVDHRLEACNRPGRRTGQVEHDALPDRSGRSPTEAPSGLTARMASANPGACRSRTNWVPSGVWSAGAKPVPPVVRMAPAKPGPSP